MPNPYADAYSSALAAYEKSEADWAANALLGLGFADSHPLMDDNTKQFLNTMQTNAMNYDVFLENRQFEADREDSAIQRQVADMKKAGLNPAMISSAPSGASSNAGSSGAPNAKAPTIMNVNLESAKQNQKANNTFLNFLGKLISGGLFA